MRASRLVPWTRTVAARLLSSSRWMWWTSFLLVVMLSSLWNLADPLYAGPDEPAHVIRAHALDHGQLTGKELSRERTRQAGRRDLLLVRAPQIYQTAEGSVCWVFRPDVTAACLRFDGPTRDVDIPITAARHPPAYYAVVGVVSWLHGPGALTVHLMRLIGALITGAFVATAITALRRSPAPPVAAVGLLLALTPMVLFVSGVVNPSTAEIAAAIAFWVCGLVLVSGSGRQPDKRLITAVGIAGCALALIRQLGPLWLSLIALAIVATANRSTLAALARSSWARLWGGLIVVSAFAQVLWDVYAKPLDLSPISERRTNLDTAEILRETFGASFGRYREMIGSFGWLDTPAPALTVLLWTAGVGFLVLLAVMFARRRNVAILVALLAATAVVPALIESSQFRHVGGFAWQGRYTLPLAVGVPIVAATALASTELGRELTGRRFSLAVVSVFVVAHILAFAQNLRRYTVGYDGPINFWKHPDWSPPGTAPFLTVAYAIVVIGFVLWVFLAARNPPTSPGAVGSARFPGAAE
jgi:hypothetical protein